MTAMSLLVQSALLVLVAYFVGAWIGCVVRRLAARSRVDDAASATATTSAAPPATRAAERFNKALAGQGPPADPNPAPSPAFEPVAPTIETIPERPALAAASPQIIEVDATPISSGSGVSVAVAQVAVTDDQAPPAETPVPVAPPKKDDFALIRGIDEAARDVLAASGIRTFAALGTLTAGDVRRLDEALGSRGRIARENWIEQAQMLAADKPTAHARRRGSTSGIQLAAPTPDEGAPLSIDAGTSTDAAQPTSNMSAEGLAAATVVAVAAIDTQPAPFEHAPHAEPVQPTPQPTGETSSISPNEDLQSISGITPEISRLLNARGVRRYAQIAGWSNSDISRIETLLGVPGRIANENWIAQARALAGEEQPEAPKPSELQPEPELARADLLSAVEPPVSSSLVGLRSVKSPAFTGGQDAAPARAGQPADLKRIRGIGVMIEKKLHMLGIHSYEQIANWTRSDIDRVSHELDFKGRIERENWVEQARILVAGGQTNFSRRFDTRSSGHKPGHNPGMNGSGN